MTYYVTISQRLRKPEEFLKSWEGVRGRGRDGEVNSRAPGPCD